MFETPILLIIFNRPDKVQKLIKALEIVKPKRLYISADGPREDRPEDKEKCAEARKIAQSISWPCEVKTNFYDKNNGCKWGPIKAINWFFENVEEGIILEDDCIPDESFFKFCEELLQKYRDHNNIMHISGNNFQDGILRGDKKSSYYFSKYTHSWGWATWKRAWNNFYKAIEKFEEYDNSKQIKQTHLSKKAQRYWIKNFRKTIRENNSWDSLWMYAVWFNDGLSILPQNNLVSNIGFGTDATHTKALEKIAFMKTQEIPAIIHPKNNLPDKVADEYTFNKMFKITLWAKITNLIKKYYA